MAVNWNMYNTRLNINGTSDRERKTQCLQSTLTDQLPDSLSYKNVLINNVTDMIEVVKTTKDYIKVIHSLPDKTFTSGDYVVYNSQTYLIYEIDTDDDIYTTGKMQLCNYTLKFQSTTGTILSYPCINSTSSNVGIDASKILSVGNGIHTIKVPFDANTVLINTDRRFIIDDASVEIPQVFAVSKPNRVEFKFGDKGIIELTMKQDVFNAQTDRKDLGICNYFDPTVVPIPPTTPTEIVTITSDATDNNIKLGLTYTFSATFKNELGVDVTGVTAVYSLDTTYSGLVVLVDNGNKTCTLKVNENAYSLLTKNVVLTCMDTAHGFSAHVTLTIIGLF